MKNTDDAGGGTDFLEVDRQTLTQMGEYFLDHVGVFDTGDDFDSPTAAGANFHNVVVVTLCWIQNF